MTRVAFSTSGPRRSPEERKAFSAGPTIASYASSAAPEPAVCTGAGAAGAVMEQPATARVAAATGLAAAGAGAR